MAWEKTEKKDLAGKAARQKESLAEIGHPKHVSKLRKNSNNLINKLLLIKHGHEDSDAQWNANSRHKSAIIRNAVALYGPKKYVDRLGKDIDANVKNNARTRIANNYSYIEDPNHIYIHQ